MMAMEHAFTSQIRNILKDEFGKLADSVFEASPLIQYLNIKTKSASRGSKSRSAFANHYAVYVIVEDYLKRGYGKSGEYGNDEGAKFTDLFRRQRELPFGGKLQNHALNSRMNEEFKKYFPTCEYQPIIRNTDTNRYWINEHLIRVKIANKTVNIAKCIIKIIDAYVAAKRIAFESFIAACQNIRKSKKKDRKAVMQFISSLLEPHVDARIFEIVSYAVLKEHYARQAIYWGWKRDEVDEVFLMLYKTGRCNANDGGIDFVMRPLGRFFQVTETLDVRKYFLDIDKVQRYPITFVVKSNESIEELAAKIKQHAQRFYGIKKIVDRYMECVEEIINIPKLLQSLNVIAKEGRTAKIMDEIVIQSKLEFNF
ncbi:MAG: hypothetical protein ABSA26_12105 [Thermoguttaceae bacterium]|jgi:hypothetical protein